MSSNPVSLLVFVGEQNYALHEMVNEYSAIGVSKKLSLTSVPDGLVKGVSKVLVAHPKAIVRVTAPDKSILELAYLLYERQFISEDHWADFVELGAKPYWEGAELRSEDFVPREMLWVTYGLSWLSVVEPSDYAQVAEDFGLEYCPGVVGYSPFSGFQVVLNNHESDLPEELEHLRPLVNMGYLEMVHVEYESGEDDALEDEDE